MSTVPTTPMTPGSIQTRREPLSSSQIQNCSSTATAGGRAVRRHYQRPRHVVRRRRRLAAMSAASRPPAVTKATTPAAMLCASISAVNRLATHEMPTFGCRLCLPERKAERIADGYLTRVRPARLAGRNSHRLPTYAPTRLVSRAQEFTKTWSTTSHQYDAAFDTRKVGEKVGATFHRLGSATSTGCSPG